MNELLFSLMIVALGSTVFAQSRGRPTDHSTGPALDDAALRAAIPAGMRALGPPSVEVDRGGPAPVIVQAVVRNGETNLQLRTGGMYFYGFVTGGAFPTTQFATGQNIKAVDAAGQLAASLAYGTNDTNNYTTRTEYHAIGGVSVAGSWDVFDSFFASTQHAGASSTTVNFEVPCDSLVIVIALASSQQTIDLQGVKDLQIDALTRGAGTEAMTIAHAYLSSGAYSVTEKSAATVPGQDPDHMVDLIGVFVLGSKDNFHGEFTPHDTSVEPQAGSADLEQSVQWQVEHAPAVTSEVECTTAGDERVRNNTRGTIRILDGTGAFEKITPGSKTLTVGTGKTLKGTIRLVATNRGPGFAVAQLIETTTWGDPRSSWHPISNLRPGTSFPDVQMDIQAPPEPGTYHILFAFQLELDGANVASGTNWSRYKNVWNDGNDLAQFNDSQIRSAQRWGCAIDSWLMEEGPQLFFVPADAVTVDVRTTPAQQQSEKTYGISTTEDLILRDQVNHPWVAFSLGENRYIALEEAIETFSTAGVDVYKVIDSHLTTNLTDEEKNKLLSPVAARAATKLTDEEKNRLFSNEDVREVVLQKLDDMKNVLPPALFLNR